MSNWLYTYDGETERVQIGGTEIVDGSEEVPLGNMTLQIHDGEVIAVELRGEAEEEDDEEIEDEPEPQPVAAPKERHSARVRKTDTATDKPPKKYKCSKCGMVGHTARRCEQSHAPTPVFDLSEDEEAAAPEPKKGKRRDSYDVTALRHNILNGMAVAAVAEKHGVSAGTVYTERWVMKQEGEQVPDDPKGRAKPAGLNDDQIEEIKQRRADGESTTEIAAVMELDKEQVAKVMADGRHGKGDSRNKKSTFDSFDDAVKRLVAQGCSDGDIKVAYPHRSDREIEEAVAYAQHAI